MLKTRTKNKNSVVLVTGGAGFIGSHLADALIRDGYKVRVLDNLSRPAHDGKLPDWFNKKAQFIKGDVRKKEDLEKALHGVSYVFHLAAYMDQHPDLSTYFDTNTKSTALMYEIILQKKLPIKKIILASSQSVYGEGKYKCSRHGIVYAYQRKYTRLKKKDWRAYCKCGLKFEKPIPQKEDDILYPQNSYGMSKKALEEIALTLGKKHAIPTVIVRYSIVHGPRQSFRNFSSGALRAYAVQAIAGELIEMHEDGKQTRDFVHIDDVIRAHLLLLKNKKADYQIFNIGSGRVDTPLKLAQVISRVLGTPFKVNTPGVFRIGTPRDSLMNISKLKKFGWRPKKSLQDNARDYINWIKKYPKAIHYLHETYRDMREKKIIR